MHLDVLRKAMVFAESLDHFLIATVAPNGQPHIAVAGELSLNSTGSLEVTDWFCQTTVANLRANPKISVVLWDKKTDLGYQLLGEAERVEDIAILDGFAPELEVSVSLPQVERRLLVRIRTILDFSQRLQSDIEE